MARSRSRFFALVVLALLPLVNCTKGNDCDKCSSDNDCNEGFVCSNFEDGSRRCGSGLGSTTCRVPR